SAFVQRVLLNEFLDDLDSIPPELTELTLPDSEARVRACRDLAQSLRDRLSMQADYADWAGTAERTFGLSGLQVDPSAIGDRDTFPFEERLALQRLCQLAETERWDEAGVWAGQHASSFWVRTDPARQSDWHTARKAVELGGMLSTTADQTPKMGSAKDLVQRYVGREEEIGLWAINKMARELDTLRSRPSLNERAEELAAAVSEKAAAWERALAEQFVDAVRANPEDLGELPSQVSIFTSAVAPLLGSGRRVVLVLADALRYEMGRELADTLEDSGEVNLSFALATPPTITKVGMAALVPQADSGLRLVGGPGGAQSYAGSLPLPSVAERRGAYADEYGSRFLDLTLDECLTLKTKQLHKRVEDASLILLRSQELDEIGEADKLVQARQWMAQVLANLRQAVARLTSAGASAFVIVADHGFLLRDDITDAEKLDPPTGEVIELHRRCVIGRGLVSSATAPVFDASELGVGGELQLAFPRGVNVFKVPGGNLSYVHGGISLQELIVPVIVYRPEAVTTSGKAQVTLEVTAKKATTAFLQVKLAYAAAGLFDQESKRRLRIDVLLDDERIGGAVSASTGFTEAGKSLSLASGEESTVFLQLENPPTGQGTLTLKVVDEELGESVLTKKVPYDIAF
ncbi:PglZ domain-containing protein, partial [Gemmatimonadota bacterium]